MYNTVKLAEEDWCYQLYLWSEGLRVTEEPFIKVIKTLIYGVKSSGNQAERGLRSTARLGSHNYPRINEVVNKDIYVDDCLSGESSWVKVLSTTDDLQVVLARGGFAVKGFAFSGKNPPSNLSTDGISIKVAGMKWYTKTDKISLDTGELNFSKRIRGKKLAAKNNQIPQEFTRRDCLSKVAEVFDLVGKATPITCSLKLDLRTLVNRKLDWDDKIPSDLMKIWLANFKTIQDLSEVQFERAVVPEDAVSLDANTIDAGDASNSVVCSAVYVRFKRKNGSYSCQLIFSRSKLVPEGMSLPRAELLAANLNATIGHIVKLALGKFHKESLKLTDSQVALHWISNTKNPLKQWVRNKVVEINRLADRSLWKYVRSKDMVADIGTRKGASIQDISSTSPWICGLQWMSEDKSKFPVKSVEEIKLKSNELSSIKAESLKPEFVEKLSCFEEVDEVVFKSRHYLGNVVKKVDSDRLKERYEFLQYIIDPNRFRLRKVVRILAMVMLFVRNLKKKIRPAELSTDAVPNDLVVHQELGEGKYLVTSGSMYSVKNEVGNAAELKCKPGMVITLSDTDIKLALD